MGLGGHCEGLAGRLGETVVEGGPVAEIVFSRVHISKYFVPLPRKPALWGLLCWRVCGHIKRRLLTLCGGLFETSQLSETKPRKVAVNVPGCVKFLCLTHTGNLHIQRGLQVACYGLVWALRRPQRERDEPIRTPRFFCVFI